MVTLTPLDVFLFWSKRIPEHAVKPPTLATDVVLLSFIRVSRSLANEAVEHILTALSQSVLLLVFGTGIKFQRLICLFPPCSRCLQDTIGLSWAAPTSEESGLDCVASIIYGASHSTCALCLGVGHPAPGAEWTNMSVGSQDFLSERLQFTWMWHWTGVTVPKHSCSESSLH